MESTYTNASITFTDIKHLPNKDDSIQVSVYRTPTHTDQHLDQNSNHSLTAKR